MKIKTTAGNWYFPTVLVNKVVYRGQIDAYNVYLDICSGKKILKYISLY